MATYSVEVQVTYYYEVEADSAEQAEEHGWKYEDYPHSGVVDSIDVDMIEDEKDEEEE